MQGTTTIGIGIGTNFRMVGTRAGALFDRFGGGASIVAFSLQDNSLLIRDSVTPANDYTGPLLTGGAFNKFVFTRASVANDVDASGLVSSYATNAPRVNSSPYGTRVLMEGNKTNICLRSQEFDNATWAKTAGGTGVVPSVSANAALAPDGTLTADSVPLNRGAGDTAADFSIISQSLTVTPASVYQASMWLKAATSDDVGKKVLLGLSNDLAAGPWLTVTLTATWARYKIARTATAATELFGVVLIGGQSVANSCSVLCWGAQVELGGWISSYITTTSASVTRLRDLLSLPSSAFNLSQTAATMYVKTQYDGGTAIDQGLRYVTSVDDSTTNERFSVYNSSGLMTGLVVDGGVTQSVLSGASVADGVLTRAALAYAANDIAFCQDGGTVQTDATATLPTTTSWKLGGNATVSFELRGGILEGAFFSRRLSNAELQALTA
jgi:hypothetical protein